MEKGSEKDIAKRHNVSTNSTNRILDEIAKDKLVKNNGHLPTSLGIDEFMATKDTIGKMAFIIVNQNEHNILILIIVENLKIFGNTFLDILNLKEIKLSLLL